LWNGQEKRMTRDRDMNEVQLLMKAYYERLHERMTAGRAQLEARIAELLPDEVRLRGLGPLNAEGMQAYRDACLAFVTERLETYNPIGIQYTFSRTIREHAAELEFQLNWYDSHQEFRELVAAARDLASRGIEDQALKNLADQLIRQMGAFPDRSIIAAYIAEPTLSKLPDYILACVIEQVVCRRET
jgi:hypothetical protein